MKKIFGLVASLNVLCAPAYAQTDSPEGAFAEPIQLSLDDVQGFAVLPLACSYNALYDLLGTYLPEGQIEGIQYVSLNKTKLMERVDPYLKTDSNKNAFNSWILGQIASDLRMRAKEVRYNQWGGQGADEWIVFCSKKENVSYLLQRNLWSE